MPHPSWKGRFWFFFFLFPCKLSSTLKSWQAGDAFIFIQNTTWCQKCIPVILHWKYTWICIYIYIPVISSIYVQIHIYFVYGLFILSWYYTDLTLHTQVMAFREIFHFLLVWSLFVTTVEWVFSSGCMSSLMCEGNWMPSLSSPLRWCPLCRECTENSWRPCLEARGGLTLSLPYPPTVSFKLLMAVKRLWTLSRGRKDPGLSLCVWRRL